MIRKAKREGKPEDYYLDIGAKSPTHADIAAARALPEAERLPWWRERFGQHCFAHHMAPEGCVRSVACAFLHAELAGEDPSWLQEER